MNDSNGGHTGLRVNDINDYPGLLLEQYLPELHAFGLGPGSHPVDLRYLHPRTPYGEEPSFTLVWEVRFLHKGAKVPTLIPMTTQERAQQ